MLKKKMFSVEITYKAFKKSPETSLVRSILCNVEAMFVLYKSNKTTLIIKMCTIIFFML
jgi:hypothetical protein